MRGRPLRTRHPSVRLISIRVGTLGGASQFLPVFARVTIDRWFNAPWPCFRDTISGEIKRSPLGREKTTGSVRWLNRDGRFVIPSLFFFSFCEVQLCFAPIQFHCWKVSLGFWLLASSFFHEDERFNDLRWNFISLLRRTVNQILRGHRLSLGGFRYLSKRAPLHPQGRSASVIPSTSREPRYER